MPTETIGYYSYIMLYKPGVLKKKMLFFKKHVFLGYIKITRFLIFNHKKVGYCCSRYIYIYIYTPDMWIICMLSDLVNRALPQVLMSKICIKHFLNLPHAVIRMLGLRWRESTWGRRWFTGLKACASWICWPSSRTFWCNRGRWLSIAGWLPPCLPSTSTRKSTMRIPCTNAMVRNRERLHLSSRWEA